VAAWLSACSLQKKIILALASSLGIIALIWSGQAFAGSWTVPEIWAQNALRQRAASQSAHSIWIRPSPWPAPGSACWPAPPGTSTRRGGYSADGTPGQRLLRYLIGLVGVLVFWFGLGQILPREADLFSYTLRYLRYVLVGLWISAAGAAVL
jgi:hypothetical protein